MVCRNEGGSNGTHTMENPWKLLQHDFVLLKEPLVKHSRAWKCYYHHILKCVIDLLFKIWDEKVNKFILQNQYHIWLLSFLILRHIRDLGVNTMSADALAATVASASEGIVLAVQARQHALLSPTEFHLCGPSEIDVTIQNVNVSYIIFKTTHHVKS